MSLAEVNKPQFVSLALNLSNTTITHQFQLVYEEIRLVYSFQTAAFGWRILLKWLKVDTWAWVQMNVHGVITWRKASTRDDL